MLTQVDGVLGLLLLLFATLSGVVIGAPLAAPLGPWTRVGMGMALGQLLLLFVPFGFALAFDLGTRAAGLSATLLLGTVLIVAAAGRGTAAPRALCSELAAEACAGRNRALLLVLLAFALLLGWLHYTHYLWPREGGLYSAGATWGDLPIHLGLATRFAYAEGLPPIEHPLFLHGPLSYPFLPDYAVAVLASTGLGLRWAFILSGMLAMTCLLLLIPGLARCWLGARQGCVPALALTLFLLAGGVGFWMVGARLLAGESLVPLLAGTNPTDIAPHVFKTSHIGNLFLAARSAAYGMSFGTAALVLLGYALDRAQPDRAALVLAGLFAGALPLVHSHSFLVLSGVLACYALLGRRWAARWAFCFVPYALAALPQLAWLLGSSQRGFVRFVPGFLQPATSAGDWLLDLGMGMGASLLLLPFALWAAPPRARRLAAPLLLLLPLANLVCFTPEVYDNVKLLAWFDLAAAVLIAGSLANLLCSEGAPRRHWARALAGWLALGACVASGALAVGHELANRALLVRPEDVRLAQLVIARTPPSAVLATAASYHDPVAMLTGRRVLIATPFMLQTHGIEVGARARELLTLYAGGEPAREVIRRYAVSAVVVGPRERSDLPRLDEAFLAQQARARYAVDQNRLYLLRAP